MARETFRPCWLCLLLIRSTANNGVVVRVNDNNAQHVHDYCLAIHRLLAQTAEWAGRLSDLQVVPA